MMLVADIQSKNDPSGAQRASLSVGDAKVAESSRRRTWTGPPWMAKYSSLQVFWRLQMLSGAREEMFASCCLKVNLDGIRFERKQDI